MIYLPPTSKSKLSTTPLPKMPKILRNIAKCKKCQDIIESINVHDFVRCKCKSIFVDGGKDYVRRGADNLDDIEDLTIYEESEEEK